MLTHDLRIARGIAPRAFFLAFFGTWNISLHSVRPLQFWIKSKLAKTVVSDCISSWTAFYWNFKKLNTYQTITRKHNTCKWYDLKLMGTTSEGGFHCSSIRWIQHVSAFFLISIKWTFLQFIMYATIQFN